MNRVLSALKIPALMATLLVIPFALLEWVNRRNFHEGLPFPLFIVLWILPAGFMLLLKPLAQDFRAGQVLSANPFSLALRLLFLCLLGSLWVIILLDQLPCFLGVPLCD